MPLLQSRICGDSIAGFQIYLLGLFEDRPSIIAAAPNPNNVAGTTIFGGVTGGSMVTSGISPDWNNIKHVSGILRANQVEAMPTMLIIMSFCFITDTLDALLNSSLYIFLLLNHQTGNSSCTSDLANRSSMSIMSNRTEQRAVAMSTPGYAP
jgi:hypothetical protein